MKLITLDELFPFFDVSDFKELEKEYGEEFAVRVTCIMNEFWAIQDELEELYNKQSKAKK